MPFDAAKLAKLQAQAGSSRIGGSLSVALLISRSCLLSQCAVSVSLLSFALLFTLLTVAALLFDPDDTVHDIKVARERPDARFLSEQRQEVDRTTESSRPR